MAETLPDQRFEGLEVLQLITADPGMRIRWSSSIGFGELTFLRDKKEEWLLNNEYMTKDFCKAVMCQLIDQYYKEGA